MKAGAKEFGLQEQVLHTNIMFINELFWMLSKDPWRQRALEGSVVWHIKEHKLQNYEDKVGIDDSAPVLFPGDTATRQKGFCRYKWDYQWNDTGQIFQVVQTYWGDSSVSPQVRYQYG